MNNILEEISQTLGTLESSAKIKRLVSEAISQRISVGEIVASLRRGLSKVGRLYEGGKYFLSELLYSASLMEDAMEVLAPHIGKERLEERGVILLATVRGDIHDIGKNVFGLFARTSGFDVIDLGVDVDPAQLVEKARELKPDVVALSTLLTTTRDEMKTIVDMLLEKKIREDVKILIGGNAVTKEFAAEIGADAAALDAVEGVEICKSWVDHP